MAEVAAHEYEPSMHDQNCCEQCIYDEQHPIHAKWSRDFGAFIQVPGNYITKDSGKREEFTSGMKRDTQDGKPRFDLLFPVGVPYSDQFLTRVAALLTRGVEKYSERNWEKAAGMEELNRFKSSAHRHLIQYFTGETDEDHMAAVVFNLMGVHLVEWKMKNE